MSELRRARVLSSAGLGEARRWLVADQSIGDDDKEGREPSDEERAAQAEKAGFEKGYAEGIERASDEMQRRGQQLATLIAELTNPLDAVDEAVEQELLDLAVAIARHLLKRELSLDPAHLVGMVREAVRQLPAGKRDIRVLLHPDDAIVVQAMLGDESDSAERPGVSNRWRLQLDPTLARGSCLVESEQSVVDASVDGLVDQLWVTLQEERRAEKHGESG